MFTNLPHQIHGFTRLFVDGQAQFVVSNGFLDGFSDFGFGLKIPVSRDHIINSLMLAKMVVIRKEMGQTLPGIGQVSRLHSAPKLFVNCFPKTLAFTQGLRVVGASHDMFDALFFEQFLKFAMTSPGKILPSLVGQDLQGFAEAGNSFLIGLYQRGCSGIAEKTPGDDVAAEVVHENDQVNPLAHPVQDKAGEVTLP